MILCRRTGACACPCCILHAALPGFQPPGLLMIAKIFAHAPVRDAPVVLADRAARQDRDTSKAPGG
eukprot:15339088-Alexandrium_andersonii.AAC.1